MTTADTADDTTGLLRSHAEQRYAEELAALAALDERPRPTGWRLSPWAVVSRWQFRKWLKRILKKPFG